MGGGGKGYHEVEVSMSYNLLDQLDLHRRTLFSNTHARTHAPRLMGRMELSEVER